MFKRLSSFDRILNSLKTPEQRNNRNRSRGKFDYLKLEHRNLLAGSGLLVNGDFESVENVDGIQTEAEVVGWQAFPDENGAKLIDVVSTEDGNVLKIDVQSGRFDRVYQDVTTASGETYLLKFDIVGKGNGTDNSDELKVFWDGALAGTFRGISVFQTVALELAAPRDGTTRLELRESFDELGGDGFGPILDNISLNLVTTTPFSNGGFELGIKPTETAHTLIADIPDWFTDGPNVERAASLRKYAEDGSRSGYYWNFDTNYRYDRLFHSVETKADKNYVITFDMRSPLDATEATNQLRVRWNGKWAATAIPSTAWQTFAVDLPGEKTGTSWLDLREAFISESNLGDGLGPWIDNIRVYEVQPSLPIDLDLNGVDSGKSSSAIFTGETLDIGLVSDAATLVIPEEIKINSMFARITNAFDGYDEILSSDTTGTAVVAVYDDETNIMTLSGGENASEYQTVLKTLRYTNLSLAPNESERIVDFNFEFSNTSGGGSDAPNAGQVPMDSGSSSSVANVSVKIASDMDDDGITDVAETTLFGTDPNAFDTDGDLLPDGIEIRTMGLNPTVPDDNQGDLDSDDLDNLDEVIFGTRLNRSDSDRDGTNDGAEVSQGSNPTDPSDKGQVDLTKTIQLQLVVGDHSGSHSERYNLIVGGIRHQAPEFGVVNTGTYTFQRGQSYPISIVHTGTNLDTPDYDYTARIVATDGTEIVIDDPQGILGVHGESTRFFAFGKTATLTIPAIELPDLIVDGFEYTVTGDSTKESNGPIPVGSDFTISATVRNDGKGKAEGYSVSLYASTDSTIDPQSDFFIGKVFTGTELEAEASFQITGNAKLPLSLPSKFHGKITLGLAIDPEMEVEETDDTNNWNSSSFFGFGNDDKREAQLYDPVPIRETINSDFANRTEAESWLATNAFELPLGRFDSQWNYIISQTTQSRYNGDDLVDAYRIDGSVCQNFCVTPPPTGRWSVNLQGATSDFNDAGSTTIFGEPSPRYALSLQSGLGWLLYVRDWHLRF